MRAFSGFPSGKVRNVSIPEQVFTDLIPIIDDLAELKLTLHILWRLKRQRGRIRYLRRVDLMSDQVLLSSLGDAPKEALDGALSRAVERGTLLQAERMTGEKVEEVYFANTPKGRAAVQSIVRGEWPDELELAERPNIFGLYEANIGLLTPLIADELRQAEEEYPPEWIEDAFREAVSLNKHSWKYIHAILKRWQVEGRGDETDRRSGKANGRRYIEGKYGEYIER